MPSDPQHIPLSSLAGYASNEDDIVVTIVPPSDPRDRVLPTQDRSLSQEEINFVDGSDTLFSMYNKKRRDFDSKLVEQWREDANGTMLISGLISAAVAGFLSQSYFSTRTNSQDVSAFLLNQTYHLQATSLNSTPIPADEFPASAKIPHVSHGAWFTSLGLSLGCAVGATLAQEWVRRYLLLTQLQYHPRRCARIQTCISDSGFLTFIPQFLGLLNYCLHTSIWLFSLGLLFLSYDTGTWAENVIVTVVYGVSTCLYMASLSLGLHGVIAASLSLLFRQKIVIQPPIVWRTLAGVAGAAQEVEKHASTHTSTLDADAMTWLLTSLTHEQEFERFLTGIPGFYESAQVKDPAQILREAYSPTFPGEIVAFMDHSLSSDLLPDTRQRRIKVSLKAVRADPHLLQRTFYHALCSTDSAIFKSVDFVVFADQYANGNDPEARSLARCIIAVAINRFENYRSDQQQVEIFRRRLKWSEALFNEHREQGHSVKLRNLVQLAWELYAIRPGSDSLLSHKIFRSSLHAACQLDVETAAVGLQHEFCDLWNQLVAVMQVWPEHPTLRSNVMLILSTIRTIFVPLHQGTESQPLAFSASTGDRDPVLRDPSSYSQCTVSSHRLISVTEDA